MIYNKNFSILIIYNENFEIFAHNRKSISKVGEEWGLFGGSLETGESFEEALIRETKEELDIDITGKYKYIGNTIFELEGHGVQKTNIYVVNFSNIDMSQINVLEGDFGEFISLENLSKKKVTFWVHICLDILKTYFKL
ncbi:MAG: NUDIX domain-containing protein [Candidatus Gracilibacteria bacterium]|nr:NUDIX domain-containing protein [Candidatus Gracilibacteria bacterium]